MSKPKLERNLEIVKLRLKDPKKWSMAKLADNYGVSKSAIQWLLKVWAPKFTAAYPSLARLVEKSVDKPVRKL